MTVGEDRIADRVLDILSIVQSKAVILFQMVRIDVQLRRSLREARRELTEEGWNTFDV